MCRMERKEEARERAKERGRQKDRRIVSTQVNLDQMKFLM